MDTTTRPPAPPRIPLLDVLRGFAILGTLAMNIWLFGYPESGGYGPVAEGLRSMFIDGKFFAMLTLLFGVGLAIQYRAAAERGHSRPSKQIWRALLLLVEGALHVVLLFSWDVLMGYAITALLVVYVLGLSERTRSAVMWTALGLHLTFIGSVTALTTLFFPVVHRQSPPMQTEEGQLYLEGSYTDQVLYRATDFLDSRVTVLHTFPLMVFLFLFGVRLYRAGAFGDDRVGRALRSRMTVWGLGLGLPLNALPPVWPDDSLFLIGNRVFSVVLMLGYVGLVGLLMDRVRRTGLVTVSLTAVGRTALSCYILQNLLASVLFYDWGLGLAAHAHHAGWMVAAWAVISLVLVAGSRWWLSRFARGPMELLQTWILARVPEGRPSSSPPPVRK
ncbi:MULTISPECIES: DUF418 domain-containing protein [Nocardiopsidaceae]|uniref:DUF418 domain-containing protein n=1 Tax=Streptomonospora nanhaiensis TaxID=1323731 RepID=A0ABY6YTB6_9ACTN|nr:DUF418 domain-containing protein [Streptomonospora nanhaiensis]WAE75638.1 DUF418 domain-containing protein [Streptomonospora nanhaiensis]